MQKNLIFELGTEQDIDEIGQLYDDINDFMANTINYPCWRKGVYPVRENAERGIRDQNLYVIRDKGRIAGTVILRHEPEPGYEQVTWNYKGDYKDILVIYTLAVHPDYLKQGIGTSLMNHIIELARSCNIKAIRLDVYESNLPAIKLYEKCGFEFMGLVDLGYGKYGLDFFKLYEKLLSYD